MIEENYKDDYQTILKYNMELREELKEKNKKITILNLELKHLKDIISLYKENENKYLSQLDIFSKDAIALRKYILLNRSLEN